MHHGRAVNLPVVTPECCSRNYGSMYMYMVVAYTTWPTLTLMFFLLTQPGLASSTSGLQSTLEMYPCLLDLFAVPTGRVLGPSRGALNILSSACQDAVPTGRIRVPSRKEVYVLPDVVASGRD